MNAITAYVDASNVYGSDEVTSALLRTYTGGKLVVGGDSEKELLPEIDGMMQVREMPGPIQQDLRDLLDPELSIVTPFIEILDDKKLEGYGF